MHSFLIQIPLDENMILVTENSIMEADDEFCWKQSFESRTNTIYMDIVLGYAVFAIRECLSGLLTI